MRLQPGDLMNSCNSLFRKTDGKYEIIPSKSQYGHWTLYIQNNETKKRESIGSMLTLREAYEYLRAFYRGIDFQKGALEINQN